MISYKNMRLLILLFFVLLVRIQSFAQNDLFRHIEPGVSLNHLTGNMEAGETGFGLSIRKIWFDAKKVNLISGLLFEKTKYHEDYLLCGPNCSYRDINFSLYSFSIPLMARLNFGKKHIFFIEGGPTIDVIPINHGKGTYHIYDMLTGVSSENEISGNFDHDYLYLGVNSGLGIIFPLSTINLLASLHYHNKIVNIASGGHNDPAEFISLRIGLGLK
jgi:hypothetical protein